MRSNIELQRGLTLVELMVALVLSLIVLGGVLQILLSSRQSYKLNDALARIQENGRYAMQTLADDIRMTAHSGCADPASVPPSSRILDTDGNPVAAVTMLDGVEGGLSSDSITVQYGAGSGVPLSVDMASPGDVIRIGSNPAQLKQGNVAAIANCQSADVFKISAESTASGTTTLEHDATVNSSGNLSQAYTTATNSRVMRWVSNTYTVGDTGRTNERGDAIFSLYRNGEELIEGVEAMQILYGERVSETTVRYVDLDTVGDVDDVVSIRLGLLLASVDGIADTNDNRTYDVAGTQVAPDGTAGSPTHATDRRIRRVFTTTIDLRNRR